VHQPRRISTSLRILIAITTGAAVALAGISAVSADPQPTLEEVRKKVDELHAEAAKANERFHLASEEVETIERRLERARKDVTRQEERVKRLTSELGGFAAAAYRNGGTDPTLQVLLAENPEDFLIQASVIDAFGVQQADHLTAVAEERVLLEQKQLVVAEELDRSEAIKQVVADEKATVDKLVREQEELLEKLEAEERARLERERQRELERQRAAAAAEREAAAQAAARSSDRQSDSAQSAAPAAEQESAPAAPPASGRAAIAVQAALSKVGYPYVYGGKGPNSFDCSGFTSWAWAQAGVSLSPSSGAQYNQGTRISANQLQPGDLLFYDSPISHVAMYIGNGQVVHASNPRTGVVIAPAMQAGGSSKPFVGAVRPG
jgi:peptidoglycan DL-endopeptidase CwlO